MQLYHVTFPRKRKKRKKKHNIENKYSKDYKTNTLKAMPLKLLTKCQK